MADPESWAVRLQQTLFGIALIAVSIFALVAPIVTGSWSLQFLCLIPLTIGLSELYATITTSERRTESRSLRIRCVGACSCLTSVPQPRPGHRRHYRASAGSPVAKCRIEDRTGHCRAGTQHRRVS